MRKAKSPRCWLAVASVPLLAAAAVITAAAPAIAGAPYSCTTSSDSGACPAAGNYTDSNIYGASGGNATVRNQIWNPVSGSSFTMSANGLEDWQDVANVPAGNTSVVGWPDSQVTLTDGNDTPIALSGFSALTSTLDLTSQSVSGAAYDNGWDIWGGVTGNESTDYQYEMMIWTNQQNRGTCGGATVLGTHAFGSQDFTLCWYGSDISEFVWYLSDASGNPVNETSSSVDIYAMLQWMISHGYYPSDYGLNQVTVGSEVCSTGGNNEDITLTGWTLDATAGPGGQLAPSAVTDAASSVTSSAATLNGSVNPEGADTTYQFDYGTSTAYGSSTTAGDAGSGSSSVAESANLTGLQPDTTYHYRVDATNSAGTTDGQDRTFTTQTSGGGTVLSQQGFEDGTTADYADWFGETISNTTAQAHGGTHSLKIASTGSNWGIQENFPGTAVAPGQPASFSGWLKNDATSDSSIVVTVNWLKDNDVVLGTQSIDASDNASGWTQWGGTFTPPSGTTSAFLQFADPGGGTHYLDDVEVVQGGTGFGGQQAPAVTTNAASGVTSSGATLNGTVNPEGADASYQFDYGTTTSYGTSVPVPAGDAGSGSTGASENYSLTGLQPSTTYHYRIESTNSGGSSYGSDQTFTTPAAGGSGTVSYAATGPSSSGQKCANCTTLSWNHAVSGSDTALLVGVGVGVGSADDQNCTVVVKDGTTALTALGKVHADNQHAGFEQVFGIAGAPDGTNAISVSVTGCQTRPTELTGGSVSFDGVSQAAPFGSAVTKYGSSATPQVATSGSASGDIIAGFAANGSAINSATSPAASRFIANEDGNSAAGNSAGATSAGTGSAVTVKWSAGSDWWGAVAVEVQHA